MNLLLTRGKGVQNPENCVDVIKYGPEGKNKKCMMNVQCQVGSTRYQGYISSMRLRKLNVPFLFPRICRILDSLRENSMKEPRKIGYIQRHFTLFPLL